MHLVDITMFYTAAGNGVSTYLNAKAGWLARHSRVQHTILSPNVCSGGAAPQLVRVPALALPGINGFRMPTSVRASTRLLRRAQPDLIEVGDAGHSAWAALRLRRKLGVPVIAFYHSDLPRLLRPRFGAAAEHLCKRYLARLYGQCDVVLAPSRAMVQQLHEFGVPDARHQALGIDSDIFHPGRRVDTLRAHLRLPPQARLLVYAGRFTPEKKLPLLIAAVRKLGRPYHLLLIGAGQALPHYPQISYIPFQHNQRQLARLLASCDLLVHPGDCETFGLIVLEAMACGLPVVSTSGGGVAELVDARTGLLAEPNNIDSLAGAIEAVWRCDLAELGANARRKAASYYDWSEILPQMMRRYQAVLGLRSLDDPGARSMVVSE